MRRRIVISAFLTVAVGLAGWIAADARFRLFSETQMLPTNALSPLRALYAVNQASAMRGSISVYDIDRGHRLVKTISTVSNVADVRGVAVSTATGKLYVSYRTHSGVGMIYCLSVYQDRVLWNRAIKPDVDRLSIHPNGRLLYVPTWEGGSADYINVLDADNGDVVREVNFSNRVARYSAPRSRPQAAFFLRRWNRLVNGWPASQRQRGPGIGATSG
jgi:outer membrane protein assembly factor BamB